MVNNIKIIKDSTLQPKEPIPPELIATDFYIKILSLNVGIQQQIQSMMEDITH